MRALLFDLDDTLTDRVPSIHSYAAQFATDFAGRLRTTDAVAIGQCLVAADGGGYRPKGEVARYLRARLPWCGPAGAPAAEELVEHWRSRFPLHAQPCAGLRETLRVLAARGVPRGVVTNGGAAVQRAKLAALGLAGDLDPVVISDEVGIRKPDPRIFGLAVRRLGLRDASGVWFVGDHPENDVLGAAAADLTPVWVAGRRPWPDGVPPPRHAIRSLPEVLRFLPSER